jgi:hypothetical protein
MPIFDTFRVKEQEGSTLILPVASNQIIAAGTLVGEPAFGPLRYAVSAADKPELNVVGVCQGALDNDNGADTRDGFSGKTKIHVRRGIFRFRNSERQPVTMEELGKLIFVENDRTVARESEHHAVAGVALALEDAFVWIWIIHRPARASSHWRSLREA